MSTAIRAALTRARDHLERCRGEIRTVFQLAVETENETLQEEAAHILADTEMPLARLAGIERAHTP